jgi:cell division protein FtsB
MNLPARYKYLALSALFVLAAINLTKTTLEILKSSKRLDDLQEEVAGLEAEKQTLKDTIRYKETDEYIEEKARNDLNLVKPGEHVYVVEGVAEDIENGVENVLSSFAKREGEEDFQDSNIYHWYKLFF